jgi:hypothetical protein
MKALQPSCEKHGGGAISPRLPRWRRFPYDIGLPGYRRADLASDSSSDQSEDIRAQKRIAVHDLQDIPPHWYPGF